MRGGGAVAPGWIAWAFDRLGTHRDAFGLPLEHITHAAVKKTLG